MGVWTIKNKCVEVCLVKILVTNLAINFLAKSGKEVTECGGKFVNQMNT